MNADSLSREEALELFFSLPDESDTRKEPARIQWSPMSKQMLLKKKLAKSGVKVNQAFWLAVPKLWDPEFTKEAVPRAVDCFALYFDEEVIEMILKHTNRAGAQRYTTKWAVLTADELRAYFGLLLLMSVSPRHRFYHYWSRDPLFNSEEIAKVMSFQAFPVHHGLPSCERPQQRKEKRGRWLR
ncbi:hypothetical protein MRX96_019155 [Rhipicephalus microplus]